ncbi:N-acetyl sugar amidotransferase [bacterium F11]|nr:N-acetyl sugar amidotransferase [bacterium F11]
MRYCIRCVIPDSRPNIEFDSKGVCNACRASETKPQIPWEKREESFQKIVQGAKKKSKGYDCLIPVSGGKDSTWQVVKCLEYGLNPLAVTWKTPARTKLGYLNLENLIQLGVDHIDYQINPKVERKFMFQALQKYGSTAIPMHMALFNIPLKIALKYEIPLVVWGENTAFEYGGKEEEQTGFKLDSKWLGKFGVTHGTTAEDWISDSLTQKELTPYFGPDPKELDQGPLSAIFLGYYFPWDPEISLRVALEKGFKVREEGPRTGLYNYADIDDDFISIHHYLKWYKFGFTRLFDNLSIEIRNNRITREKAIDMIRERGDDTPHEDIKKFCEFVEIKEKDFFDIAEQYRNINIWKKQNGLWKITDFIIQDWKWR